ncbi:MAG: M48 family peptidase [Marinilabiliales bacterium]|nr:MAG: M48 family peptidase [Marinilabiliales bacterium]
MANERTYDIPEIGNATVRKSNRAKRARIAIKPGPQIIATIPAYLPYEKGITFILQKKEWILNTLQKFEIKTNDYLTFTPQTEYCTRNHRLVINTRHNSNLSFTVEPGITLVQVPEEATVTDPQIQEWIKKAIEETWRIEAKAMLPQKVSLWAQRYNFKYQNVTIRNSKTRWGSCSSNGNINLSLHLMRLPEELIDFVILHELTHTVHKNHGPQFHALLDIICGGKEKELNARLRTFKMGDYRMYHQLVQ